MELSHGEAHDLVTGINKTTNKNLFQNPKKKKNSKNPSQTTHIIPNEIS